MISKYLTTEFTGKFTSNEDYSVRASFEEGDKGAISLDTDQHKQHFLFLKIGCMFVARDEEKTEAIKKAERQLKHELYKDVLSGLYEALATASDSATRLVLNKLINDILE